MHPQARDEIARLRAEIRHFQDLGRINRQQLKDLKSLPISQRDRVAELRCEDRIIEYRADVRRNKAKIEEWKATQPSPTAGGAHNPLHPLTVIPA